MTFAVRPYHASDLYALYQICWLTGSGAADPTSDPELCGHYYAAPYAVFEPDLCFILTHDEKPCGYVIGTRDTDAFRARCERDWFPGLRKRYPLRSAEDKSCDAGLIRRIHSSGKPDPTMSAYPAHLHIDLLTSAQGQKLGHRLMEVFLERLEVLGVAGIHLGTGAGNTRAVSFYDRVGFKRLVENAANITFGMLLPRKMRASS